MGRCVEREKEQQRQRETKRETKRGVGVVVGRQREKEREGGKEKERERERGNACNISKIALCLYTNQPFRHVPLPKTFINPAFKIGRAHV